MKIEQMKEAYEQIPEDLKGSFIELTSDYKKRKRTIYYSFVAAEALLLLLFAITILMNIGLLWLILMAAVFFIYNHFYYKMLNLLQRKWEKVMGTPPYLYFSDMEEMHERWLRRKQ